MKYGFIRFFKNHKKEIIIVGAVLSTACVGGLVGANMGLRHSKIEMYLCGSDGMKIKEFV